ncbi:MAG: hypothetical protein A3A98_03545 [Candidatus Staskawiczbacteria bacterium RIFCSPLOWO2_01_FULL_40_39]|uniref:GtrA/DPMS transmembrane domain-containing protein n=1 Tax=Candidatus Staskawiczbacteria bacterium RIFCSPHIGHO2_01_FULL_39_25 TaxID=1802202 RepID=A0A1G2HQT9_9BACT|nr:MAG: hypothetical protein A2730_02815 [Candidatus Staskawiczbacteria bacterium RIFCSPHIGHO2_01_FULL_39_25]OGZ72886.1 MAG: hypothetical protein A3A98_03545 [Candidatus Staskawiczbacteria bacterium RIFCSPLOWO2_01_FULL_40_39]
MKLIDVISSIICGAVIGILLTDFMQEWGIAIGFYSVFLWMAAALVSLICLYIAYLISKKIFFVFQVAKFLLVGAFATVIDLKFFEFLIWLFALFISLNYTVAKSISFLFATSIKYWGNKYWAFGKHEKEGSKEIIQFFMVTLVGLVIDVGFFYYFTKITGPQFGASNALWIKISVIFAAIMAAIWNFLGYKFLVFKK